MASHSTLLGDLEAAIDESENILTALPGKTPESMSTENTSTDAKGDEKGAPKSSKGKKAKKPTTTTVVDDGSTPRSKGLDELNQKIDQLTNVVNSFAPVIKELKTAYDAAVIEESDGSEIEDDGEVEGEPSAKRSKTQSENSKSIDGLVDVLVQEVTEDEQTDKPLNEKIAKVLDNILASGLNDQALSRRKEQVKRPENCKFLRVTKVNAEIWDIAQKTTRSMDVRLQKLQESLIKGLTPIAHLTGVIGETMEKKSAMPTPEEFWESLSNSTLLIASANHDLNMCRRDLFKADLDAKYKTICSSKEPVGSELFGDDLTEKLKSVKESKKAAQQLTNQKQKSEESSSRGSHNSKGNFLFRRRGRFYQGRSQSRGNYNYNNQKEGKSYQSGRQTTRTAKQK